jgi:hypothetical protein
MELETDAAPLRLKNRDIAAAVYSRLDRSHGFSTQGESFAAPADAAGKQIVYLANPLT